MAWYQQRLDRLREIVAEAVKRDMTPRKTGFADFVNRMAASYGLAPDTTRKYVHTLVDAFYHDHWAAYLRNNDYLSKEEIQHWINMCSQK